MKKITIVEAMAMALALTLIVAFSGCKEKKEASSKPILRVGMECAYAPFNWTQDTKTT